MESNIALDSMLPRNVKEYQLLSILGKGANGIVYKATKMSEDRIQYFAVKEVKI